MKSDFFGGNMGKYKNNENLTLRVEELGEFGGDLTGSSASVTL